VALYFFNFSDILYPKIREKRFARPVLLMDNASSHRSRPVTDYIKERRWGVLSQDPYSPDQQPADNDGFRRIKQLLRVFDIEDEALMQQFFARTIQDINAHKCFVGVTKLPDIWKQIIERRGDYAD